MFLLILISYLLMIITTALLFLTGFQGLARVNIYGINHSEIGLLTTMIFVLTESFILTFISALVKSIMNTKTIKNTHQLANTRSLIYKNGILSVLWITIVFLLGGAVDTNLIKPFFHGMIFFLGLIHFFYTLKLQNNAFKVCLQLINE